MTYQLNFYALGPYLPELLSGILSTIILTLIATIGGISAGVLGVMIRNSKYPLASRLWAGYVEFIRNTPFVIQLFFIVFGLPELGLKVPTNQATLLALIINLGAYSTEIIRAGIQVTPNEQWEAGRVLGLTRRQIFFYIVLPPALQRVYPLIVSQCVIIMLSSSVVSQVSYEELSFAAYVIQSRTFCSFEVYLVVTFIYFVLAVLMRKLLLFAGRQVFKGLVQ